MSRFSFTHLSDQTLRRHFAAADSNDSRSTASFIAYLAEFDARHLYLEDGQPSMASYCVHVLHRCEQESYKRIRVARTARRFPAIFDALADGRLHLTAVILLSPYLTEETEELLEAAAHKSSAEIEQLLVERFPRPDVPTLVMALTSPSGTAADRQLSARTVEPEAGNGAGSLSARTAEPPAVGAGGHGQLSARTVQSVLERGRVKPLSPGRFAVQFAIAQSTHEKLRYAQELLSHQLPSGDVAQVFDRALDALISRLEKRKWAATSKPRPGRPTASARHIPADVRRAVWQRDGGQCTFVSATGQRCPGRRLLEFDHMDEVARGGEASVSRIRLRCRAHNQYEAERTFGAEFMERKRRAAIEARAAARARAAEGARAAAETRAAQARAAAEAHAAARAREVIPWLRQLGFHADEARKAATLCEPIPDAPLEERVRVALSCFGSKGVHRAAPRSAGGSAPATPTAAPAPACR